MNDTQELLEIGVESGNFEQLGRELDRVGELFAIDDVSNLFRNPKFDAAARKAVLAELLVEVAVSPLCRNFLYLLVDRSEHVLGSCPPLWMPTMNLPMPRLVEYGQTLRWLQALNDADLERLRAVLQAGTGKQVVIEQTVEGSTIVGGVIAHVGGRVYDGSIRTQLETLHSRLKTSRM